jgi:hypothetical protein
MPDRDPRVDAYIDRAAPLAQPILRHLRDVVHAACPEVEETIKWGFPHFDYRGMMCSMAAFKAHCAFGFWKPELVLGSAARDGAMGQLGPITSLDDLPAPDVLRGYVEKAVALNDEGVPPKRAARARKPVPEPEVPGDLADALREHEAAAKTFAGFSPGHRREYVEWITEAKREATRARRIAQAVEWLTEGKPRNWKYR